MSDTTEDLIALARRVVEETGVRQSTILISHLADALKSVTAERDNLRAVIREAQAALPTLAYDSEDCGYVYDGDAVDEAAEILSRTAEKGQNDEPQ